MRALIGLGLLATAVVLSGCSGEKPNPNAVKLDPNAKLVMTDLAPGDGPAAATGDTAFVMYKGTLRDGTVFDTNIAEGRRIFTVTLGQGMVIKGWDEGIVGMKPGGKRKLVIPPNLGYGSSPMGEKIPANAELTFEIELVYLLKKGEEGVYDATTLAEGTGPEVKKGDTIKVHYKASYLRGEVIDDTRLARDKQPITFKVGDERVVQGLDFAVIGMKAGGKKKVIFPPTLVFGQIGSMAVEGNLPIEVEIEVVSVN